MPAIRRRLARLLPRRSANASGKVRAAADKDRPAGRAPSGKEASHTRPCGVITDR